MDFSKLSFLGNDPKKWGVALVVFLAAFLAFRLLRRILVHRMEVFSRTTVTRMDDLVADLLRDTKGFVLFFWALYAGLSFVALPERIQGMAFKSIVVISLVQVAIWGTKIVTFWVENFMRARGAEDVAAATTIGLVSFLARFVLYSMLVLLGLNNLGVDITALVAGMGVGGIAVALAVQNILGDLFASLTIVLDKPFVVGDFVVVGEHMGTIERIGLKTTRVRSLSGEQLIFPNSDLLQSRIRNFKRMTERRVVFSIGVTYQTPSEKLEAIPRMIRGIVERQSQIRFERSHFKGFGSSTLDFETVYWVTNPDMAVFMDLQQAINLELFRRFAAEGIEFAYPTQKLFVEPAVVPVSQLL